MAKKATTGGVRTRKAVARRPKPAQSRPGRLRLAKADGDAPVQAYIQALSGWKKDIAQRFDDLVKKEVPNAKRAVKWSSPMYGIEGKGWFASFSAFSKHVKIVFFEGAVLKPPVPSGSSEKMRGLDLKEEDDFPEGRIAS